jgi:hypothetical protein
MATEPEAWKDGLALSVRLSEADLITICEIKARYAYACADAMLKERVRGQGDAG